MSDELDFDDITPLEVPVKIGGKSYVLREATGDAAVRYRNALLRATKLGPDGRPASIDGMANAEPLLVSLCLFEVTDRGEKGVPEPVVRGWPSRVQTALFERVKKMSRLDEPDTKDVLTKRLEETQRRLDEMSNGESHEKNSLVALTGGSG